MLRTVLQEVQVPDLTTREGQLAVGIAAAALLGFSLIQIPVGGFLRARLLGPARQPSRAREDSFQWVDLLLAVLVFVGSQLVLSTALAFRYPELKSAAELGGPLALGFTALGFLPPCAYVWYAAGIRRDGWRALGVASLAPGRRGLYAALRYLVGLPFFMGMALLATAAMGVLGIEKEEQEVAGMIRDSLEANPLIILAFAVVIVPLLEEVLFRGLLLELLAKSLGSVGAIILSAAAFGLLHGTAAAAPIFALAVILGIIKLRTRSLGACWLVHGLHNGGTTLMLYLGPEALLLP